MEAASNSFLAEQHLVTLCHEAIPARGRAASPCDIDEQSLRVATVNHVLFGRRVAAISSSYFMHRLQRLVHVCRRMGRADEKLMCPGRSSVPCWASRR